MESLQVTFKILPTISLQRELSFPIGVQGQRGKRIPGLANMIKRHVILNGQSSTEIYFVCNILPLYHSIKPAKRTRKQ